MTRKKTLLRKYIQSQNKDTLKKLISEDDFKKRIKIYFDYLNRIIFERKRLGVKDSRYSLISRQTALSGNKKSNFPQDLNELQNKYESKLNINFENIKNLPINSLINRLGIKDKSDKTDKDEPRQLQPKPEITRDLSSELNVELKQTPKQEFVKLITQIITTIKPSFIPSLISSGFFKAGLSIIMNNKMIGLKELKINNVRDQNQELIKKYTPTEETVKKVEDVIIKKHNKSIKEVNGFYSFIKSLINRKPKEFLQWRDKLVNIALEEFEKSKSIKQLNNNIDNIVNIAVREFYREKTIQFEKLYGKIRLPNEAQEQIKYFDKKVEQYKKSIQEILTIILNDDSIKDVPDNYVDLLVNSFKEIDKLIYEVDQLRLGINIDFNIKFGEADDLTLPWLNFCGQDTKLINFMELEPVNELDAICKQHDIDYQNAVTYTQLNEADTKMIDSIDDLLQKNILNEMDTLDAIYSQQAIKIKRAFGNFMEYSSNIMPWGDYRVLTDEQRIKVEEVIIKGLDRMDNYMIPLLIGSVNIGVKDSSLLKQYKGIRTINNEFKQLRDDVNQFRKVDSVKVNKINEIFDNLTMSKKIQFISEFRNIKETDEEQKLNTMDTVITNIQKETTPTKEEINNNVLETVEQVNNTVIDPPTTINNVDDRLLISEDNDVKVNKKVLESEGVDIGKILEDVEDEKKIVSDSIDEAVIKIPDVPNTTLLNGQNMTVIDPPTTINNVKVNKIVSDSIDEAVIKIPDVPNTTLLNGQNMTEYITNNITNPNNIISSSNKDNMDKDELLQLIADEIGNSEFYDESIKKDTNDEIIELIGEFIGKRKIRNFISNFKKKHGIDLEKRFIDQETAEPELTQTETAEPEFTEIGTIQPEDTQTETMTETIDPDMTETETMSDNITGMKEYYDNITAILTDFIDQIRNKRIVDDGTVKNIINRELITIKENIDNKKLDKETSYIDIIDNKKLTSLIGSLFLDYKNLIDNKKYIDALRLNYFLESLDASLFTLNEKKDKRKTNNKKAYKSTLEILETLKSSSLELEKLINNPDDDENINDKIKQYDFILDTNLSLLESIYGVEDEPQNILTSELEQEQEQEQEQEEEELVPTIRREDIEEEELVPTIRREDIEKPRDPRRIFPSDPSKGGKQLTPEEERYRTLLRLGFTEEQIKRIMKEDKLRRMDRRVRRTQFRPELPLTMPKSYPMNDELFYDGFVSKRRVPEVKRRDNALYMGYARNRLRRYTNTMDILPEINAWGDKFHFELQDKPVTKSESKELRNEYKQKIYPEKKTQIKLSSIPYINVFGSSGVRPLFPQHPIPTKPFTSNFFNNNIYPD